jgi:hypothetical protein
MRKDHRDWRLSVIVAGEQQHVRRLRETDLDSRRELRALGTVEPSLHRLVGFETENRHPLCLQTRDRAKYFRADEAWELPGRVSNGGLRFEVFLGLVSAYQMGCDRSGRPGSLRYARFSGVIIHKSPDW